MTISDREPARQADEEVHQFEKSLTRRLRQLADTPAPSSLMQRGLEMVRSQREVASEDRDRNGSSESRRTGSGG